MKFKWLPLFLIILLGCIWGSSFILMKRGLVVFTPIQVAGMRLFLAGIFLTPWVYRYSLGSKSTIVNPVTQANEKLLKPIDYFYLFLTGFVGNAIPAFLFSTAGTLIPSGLSGILNAFTPMFTLVVGSLFFTSPLSRNGFLGVVAGIIGAVFLLGPSILGQKGMEIHLGGAIMALTASVLYGYNINLIKTKLAHIPPMAKTAYPFVFMGILYAFVLWKTDVIGHYNQGPVELVAPFNIPANQFALICLIILGVIGSAVSMMLFNYLIEHTTALVASTNTFVIPIVAVAWGLIDQEPIRWNMIVGLFLSLVGVYLVMKKE
ncbi:MAG: DMT family transporter [Bacteroidetes bacterium]|nr:DMT family transporter [Bacteroidota bacterium]NBX63920.1 DMT family transporter [Bacteroidota bacterium]